MNEFVEEIQPIFFTRANGMTFFGEEAVIKCMYFWSKEP